jgi:hypothetical protein
MKKDPILRIYESALPLFGKFQSREYVSNTINLLILDLEEAGELTDKNFQEALLKEADWSEKASEKALKEKKNQDVA